MKKIVLSLLTLLFFYCSYAGTDTPYVEKPLELSTTTGKIYGTITVPEGFRKGTVALIIAGSGPTDRNGNNPMMKNESLKYLAYELAKAGYASLRYDKRAIAESKGAARSEKDLRFEDYINDAAGWIKLLKKDKRFQKLVVMGHSEGSLIGMVAARQGASGFVSLAGAGRPVQEVLKEQLSAQPKVIRDTSYAIIDSLVAGKEVKRVNPVLFSLFRPSVQPYLISWFRYDPTNEIKKLKMPVLIVQGTKDIQVSVEDAKLLSKAAPKAELKIIEGMNHVLKHIEGERSENVASYSDPSLPLDTVLVKDLVSFLKKNKL